MIKWSTFGFFIPHSQGWRSPKATSRTARCVAASWELKNPDDLYVFIKCWWMVDWWLVDAKLMRFWWIFDGCWRLVKMDSNSIFFLWFIILVSMATWWYNCWIFSLTIGIIWYLTSEWIVWKIYVWTSSWIPSGSKCIMKSYGGWKKSCSLSPYHPIIYNVS